MDPDGRDSVLPAIYDSPDDEDADETLEDALDLRREVEMLDAVALDADVAPTPAAPGASLPPPGVPRSRNQRRKAKRRNRRKRQDSSAPSSIADINRFVIDACRRLKEKKSYLVWNAVGCLGVSVVHDLVKEVDAIQRCGGQVTADGSRFRNGGGILWNILKAREPKAYKEIMSKGREFEKQLRRPNFKQTANKNEDTSSQSTIVPGEDAEPPDAPDQSADDDMQEVPCDIKTERKPVLDRIRVPVAYDDLFEEGEIHE